MQAGDVLANRFEIRSQIGSGAFGAVYLAYDRELARLVAVKELSANNTELDSKEFCLQKQKFEREARSLSQFQHQNVVSVYQILHEVGADYLIMEYVAGGTLRRQLDSVHALSVERSLAVALDICRAIGTMSKYGIVHRDIKPSNILLTPDGSAKLTDFGIAQLSHVSERSKAVGTRHPGTPKYMSPEQEISVGYLDERSDLYSLGLVLYEMLAGQAFKAVRKPVRQVNPDVPRWLEILLEKALQPDRDKRFQSAKEMEEALLRVRSRSAAFTPVPRVPRSSKAVWAVMSLIVVAVIIVLGLIIVPPILSNGNSTPTVAPTIAPVSIKTATPTVTLTPTTTPTNTSTATMTPTPYQTDTPIPTPTNTQIPTRRPTVNVPTVAPAVMVTATPDCGAGRVWNPVMGRCQSGDGGGGGPTPPPR